MRKTAFLLYLFPLLLAFLIFRPIMSSVWYPMHDTTHVARLYLMQETVVRGEFPPIWAEGINGGLGYPLFHFYAPAFYYLSLFLSYFVGYFAALKLALSIFVIIGIYSVMGLVRSHGRGVMILAATLFVTSPYLAVNLYVRGAYAEIAALCLFPAILLSWQNLKDKKGVVIAPLVTSLFLMSHNLLPILAFPLIAFYAFFVNRRNLISLIMPSILTLILSGSYILPLVFERNFVLADTVAKTSDYTLHFVMPWQIWNSTWGFGGSAAGVEDGFSFKMGKLHLILFVMGAYFVIRKKIKLSLMVLGVIYLLFMTTNYSSIIWTKVSILPLAQFPWRHLALATSLIAVVGGMSVYLIKYKWVRVGWVIVLSLLSLFINLKYFAPQYQFPDNINLYISDEYLSTIAKIIPEYRPAWQKTDSGINNLYEHIGQETVINRAYYPTWQVTINGQKTKTYPNNSGLLTVSNPTNSENIVIRQVHTPLQIAGYCLTLLGIVISLIYYFFLCKTKK